MRFELKIAIVVDWLVKAGGAEIFLSYLLECFPEADLFSVIDFFSQEDREKFLKGKSVQTSFIQKLPWARTKYRAYLPLMPLAIEQLDLSSYDLIISSSHAVAKGVMTGPDQIHVAYIHSPMRYAWDLQGQYLRESNLSKGFKSYLVRYLLHKLRAWDVISANRPDYLLANSKFIARRIKKTYRRDATVLYPGIDLDFFCDSPGVMRQDFYLTASRMVPYKKMDLIVQTFAEKFKNKELVVIGDGPDFEKIKKLASANSNIKLLGYQPREVLLTYLQKAKAFVFAAEEDFGLAPIEAQACGTPVIAYGKGGALETIGIDSGFFFDAQTVESLSVAIDLFEERHAYFTAEKCRKNAERFAVEIFKKNIKDYVLSIVEL